MREGNLECERDEGIRQTHYQIRHKCRDPAPQNQLPELQRRVPLPGRDELHVDRQIKGEAKERDDDEVNETDRHSGRSDGGVEGAEIKHREADGGVEGLRGKLERCTRDGGVGENFGRPLLAEHGCYLGLKHGELGEDVVVVRRLVASGLVYNLARAQGIEGGITLLHSLL